MQKQEENGLFYYEIGHFCMNITKIRPFRDGLWCGKQDLNLHEGTFTRT